MDDTTRAILIIGFLVAVAAALLRWRISWRIKEARRWPVAEATIHSAELGRVGRGRKMQDLPCFEFSYMVKGHNYSGHFALRASGDQRHALMRQMTNKKMNIHYDPKMPQGWYIPVDTIGGSEVLQKLRPEFDPQQAKD